MTTSDILAGEPELVATGFKFTEGPVWHPDGVPLLQRHSGSPHLQINARWHIGNLS